MNFQNNLEQTTNLTDVIDPITNGSKNISCLFSVISCLFRNKYSISILILEYPDQNVPVYPDNMMKNLEKLGGLVFSQRVLLALTQGGMDRETSYKIVQRNAKKVWEKDLDFLSELKSDLEVKKIINEKELESLFDIGYHTKNIDKIFTRVFDK